MPTWIKSEEATIPTEQILKAAEALKEQLGHKGIDKVGGSEWWKWRKEGEALRAEWIEMRSHFERRQRSGDPGRRVMLYVHGGAYFFGSVDEHRYQLQRHARKLEARVFAPRYRLAPQFPFPCGLLDCLAAYLYLLTTQDSSTIVFAGDSAGGGMVLSLLVILRDQGLPLPAGAVLISPWVDLTHSFPSVGGDNSLDYIPAHGFLARPSRAWPPPNEDDMEQIAMHAVEKAVGESMPRKSTQQERHQAAEAAAKGIVTEHKPDNLDPKGNKNNPAGPGSKNDRTGDTIPGPENNLSIMISGKLIHVKDQIQMYTTNSLISHPLVSPILQPSLGGLPPLLILSGGGEVLRDEQIYLAHKAANPQKYPPGKAYLEEYPHARETTKKYKPTDVQLQVWDDLCHVAPTLSFTRPAAYMYRSVAQFSAWALACAQKTSIDIPDDDTISLTSSASSTSLSPTSSTAPAPGKRTADPSTGTLPSNQIGKAGDPIPPFKSHMIRQRVDHHGNLYPLPRASELPACQMSPNDIGVTKPIPLQRWLEAKTKWDIKFAKEKRKVQKQRIEEMAKGYRDFAEGDVPPPSALAGRRGVIKGEEGGEKKKKSWGMGMGGRWGSKREEKAMEREKKVDREGEKPVLQADDGAEDNEGAQERKAVRKRSTSGARSRSRVRRRQVSNLNQRAPHENDETAEPDDNNSPEEDLPPLPISPTISPPSPEAFPTHVQQIGNDNDDYSSPNTTKASTTVHTTSNRPYENGVAYPFKLATKDAKHLGANPSTVTLHGEGEQAVAAEGESAEAAP